MVDQTGHAYYYLGGRKLTTVTTSVDQIGCTSPVITLLVDQITQSHFGQRLDKRIAHRFDFTLSTLGFL